MKRDLELVVAADLNNAIGVAGKLPWHLPEDLRHFKSLTLNHAVIMGRKTYDAIGKALPKRRNIIITRDTTWTATACEHASSPEAALNLCKANERIFIIGGGEIYALFLPMATTIHLTRVATRVNNADAFFPPLDDRWQLASSQNFPANSAQPLAFAIERFERI
jgi:dihydrofolate reductase